MIHYAPTPPATLCHLPAPPASRAGWPWTTECQPLSEIRSDGTSWPRFTIVVPSYNQGHFIEETLRSIVLQGYPNLELIVIDGGSSDQTVETLKCYGAWISYWISEADAGQADAINKGLALASGELFQFINSDDVLAPNALAHVACLASAADAVAGAVEDFGAGAATRTLNKNLTASRLISQGGRKSGYIFHQPGVFLRTDHLREVGGYDSNLRYVFDYKAMIRYLDRFPRVSYIQETLVHFRLHGASKTVSEGNKFGPEFLRARRELLDAPLSPASQKILKRTIQSLAWPSSVTELRASSGGGIRFIAILLGTCIRQPQVALNRFTFGAIRRELFGIML